MKITTKLIRRTTAIILVCLLMTQAPLLAAGYNVIQGKSNASQTTYEATVTIAQTTVGSQITVNWSAPAGHPSNDYIRLAETNSSNGSYHWSQSLGSGTAGSFTVAVPSTVAKYHFRIFRGADGVRAATSQSFIVNQPNFSINVSPALIPAGGQITTTWNVPAGRPVTDRVVIAETAQSSSQYISQQYTNGLNPGEIRLAAPVQPGQYEARYFQLGSAAPSAVSSTFVVEAAAAEIAGQITQGGNGDAIAGATIEVRQNGTTKATAVTDTSGAYNIPLSSAGTYDLQASAPGFPPAGRTGVEVPSGGTAVANFQLFNAASLSGKITKSATGGGLSGAGVQLKQGATVIATTITNSAGNYNFAQISPGNYSLAATATGYQSQTQNDVTLTAGGSVNLNLALAANSSGGGGGSGGDSEFVYDNAGRLVARKEQGVVTNIYSYDASGNLLSVLPPPANAPAIISFSPNRGLPGTQVVIQGVGFAASAAQNTIAFNGTTAAVVSASETEIITTVPAGAATGSITVTTPSGTAASGANFVVETETPENAPVITGFAPLVGRPNDAITVNGNNFESEPSDNAVAIGKNFSTVTTATASTLTIKANTSSGKISVATPSGKATSAADFFLVPPAVNPAQVHFMKRTWFGNRLPVEIPTLDKLGVMTFDGAAGKNFSVQIFNLKNNVKFDIYRPDGKLILTQSFTAPAVGNAGFIDTHALPLSGTYTIVMTPSGSSSIATTFSAVVHDVAHVYAQIPPGGSKQAWIGTPGQNAYFSYYAEAGQKILLKIDSTAHNGTAKVSETSAAVFRPPIANVSYQPAPAVSVQQIAYAAYTPDGVTVPATGTYSIDIDPTGAEIGPATASLWFVPPDPTFQTSIGNRFGITLERYPETPPGLVTIPCPRLCIGQNAWYKFSGTAGQKVSLLRTDNASVDSLGLVKFNLNKPNGQFLVPITDTGNGSFIDAVTLPETGEYRVFLDPYGASIGNADFELFGIPDDIVGSTSINGPPVTVTAAVPGHNPSVTFTALEGQQARVNVSNATVPNGTPIRLKKTDGTVLASGTIASGGGLISSTLLASTGTYVVEVDPGGTALGSATLSVGGDVYQTFPTGGGAATATVTHPGQSAWFTFTGTAGQRVSLTLSNVTIASGMASFRNPNGTLLGNAFSFNTSGGFVDTVVLPTDGEYKIVVDPDSTHTGSATLTLHNVPPDAAGSLRIGGEAETRNVGVPGQNLAFTFNGTSGERVDVAVNDVTIPGTLDVSIRKPNGAAITNYYTGVWNIQLPETGVYTVYINPLGAGTGNLTVRLGGVFREGNSVIQMNPSVSVRVGNGPIEMATQGVSVTRGAHITGISPAQIAKGTTGTLTVTGSNLSGTTAIYFMKSDGTIDNSLTATNLSVNPDGTILTVTVAAATNAAVGERVVWVANPNGSSPSQKLNANFINVVP